MEGRTVTASTVKGIRVFYKLRSEDGNGLTQVYDDYKTKLVLCQNAEPSDTKKQMYARGDLAKLDVTRKFMLFNDYLHFNDVWNQPCKNKPDGKPSNDFTFNKNHWFELIFTDVPQKPKFDIDIYHDDICKKLGLYDEVQPLTESFMGLQAGSVSLPTIPQVQDFIPIISNESYPENWNKFLDLISSVDSRILPNIDGVLAKHNFEPGCNGSIATITGLIIQNGIMYIMRDLYNQLDFSKNFLIYDSTSTTKFSRHVIIDGFCCANSQEAEIITRHVKQKFPDYGIPQEFSSLIDEAVYSQTQQFRMVYMCKIDVNGKSGPKKLPLLEYNFKDGDISNPLKADFEKGLGYGTEAKIARLNVMRRSLISFTADCEFLTPLEHYELRTYGGGYIAPESQYTQQVYEIFDSILETEYPGCFAPCKYDGKGLRAERLKPSLCLACSSIGINIPHERTAITAYISRDGWLTYKCFQNGGLHFQLYDVASAAAAANVI